MNTNAPSHARPLLVSGAALLGAVALSVGGAAAANAHVTISPDTAEAGQYAVLTVGVPHGCDGSATTQVSIKIPDGINSITPTRHPFYTVEKVMEPLVAPVSDGHGGELTERPTEIVYTATTPLPANERDAFQLVLKVPEDAAGTTLYSPSVQTCEEGESAWVQIPAEGQNLFDLDLPSPALNVVASEHDGHGHDHAEDAHDESTAEDSSASGQLSLIITSLAIGALGLIAGVVALIRGGKSA